MNIERQQTQPRYSLLEEAAANMRKDEDAEREDIMQKDSEWRQSIVSSAPSTGTLLKQVRETIQTAENTMVQAEEQSDNQGNESVQMETSESEQYVSRTSESEQYFSKAEDYSTGQERSQERNFSETSADITENSDGFIHLPDNIVVPPKNEMVYVVQEKKLVAQEIEEEVEEETQEAASMMPNETINVEIPVSPSVEQMNTVQYENKNIVAEASIGQFTETSTESRRTPRRSSSSRVNYAVMNTGFMDEIDLDNNPADQEYVVEQKKTPKRSPRRRSSVVNSNPVVAKKVAVPVVVEAEEEEQEVVVEEEEEAAPAVFQHEMLNDENHGQLNESLYKSPTCPDSTLVAEFEGNNENNSVASEDDNVNEYQISFPSGEELPTEDRNLMNATESKNNSELAGNVRRANFEEEEEEADVEDVEMDEGKIDNEDEEVEEETEEVEQEFEEEEEEVEMEDVEDNESFTFSELLEESEQSVAKEGDVFEKAFINGEDLPQAELEDVLDAAEEMGDEEQNEEEDDEDEEENDEMPMADDDSNIGVMVSNATETDSEEEDIEYMGEEEEASAAAEEEEVEASTTSNGVSNTPSEESVEEPKEVNISYSKSRLLGVWKEAAEENGSDLVQNSAVIEEIINDMGNEKLQSTPKRKIKTPKKQSTKKKTPKKKTPKKTTPKKKTPKKKSPMKKATPMKKKTPKKKSPMKKTPKKKTPMKKTPKKKTPMKKATPMKKTPKKPMKVDTPKRKTPSKKKSPIKKGSAKSKFVVVTKSNLEESMLMKKKTAKKATPKKKSPKKRRVAKKKISKKRRVTKKRVSKKKVSRRKTAKKAPKRVSRKTTKKASKKSSKVKAKSKVTKKKIAKKKPAAKRVSRKVSRKSTKKRRGVKRKASRKTNKKSKRRKMSKN